MRISEQISDIIISSLLKSLIHASREGHVECVRLFLDAGVGVNVQDDKGTTALMGSSYCGRFECVRLLVAAGADKTLRDKVILNIFRLHLLSFFLQSDAPPFLSFFFKIYNRFIIYYRQAKRLWITCVLLAAQINQTRKPSETWCIFARQTPICGWSADLLRSRLI